MAWWRLAWAARRLAIRLSASPPISSARWQRACTARRTRARRLARQASGARCARLARNVWHGVRSVEDAALVEHLAERHIPIEACPTSNLRLGVYPSLAEHPLPRLYAAGVPLTINSDDPPLFNTTLNQEVALLADPFGFELATINDILLNGVRQSFLPPQEKAEMLDSFQAEMAALQRVQGL